MHILFKDGDHKEEFDVVEGDIIIKFYESKFEKQMIVVKSKEWADNIIAYEKLLQEQREQWAKEKTAAAKICGECEPCTPDCKA